MRAFTLIELLAVIAVVAVLAALGIPAVRIGIARAQSAKCLGNLREIGVGLNAWLADNNMTMPPLAAGRKSRDENVPVIDTVLAPYLPDPRVFACPADKSQAAQTGTSASWKSVLSGPSAVKMNGPYDYVTPNYWYLDQTNGGAFGFNTETSPGPQPPPLETLQRMFPAGHLWPMDDVWNFHCARKAFGQMDRYLNAFNHRYGEAKSVEEFAFKSQAANYEAMRAMFEAFAVNLPHTTGIIQWMLNASWPKLYWQLYDYYLTPGGAFFGAKKGAAPLAVIYNYGNQGVYLVNQTGKHFGNHRTTIAIYDLNSKKILEQTVTNTSVAYGSEKIFDLSNVASPTPVYFLDLKSSGDFGPEAGAENFYWLSTKPDVLDESKTQWFVTPNQSFADFTALNQLPVATVHAGISFAKKASGTEATVTLANDSDRLAFFIEMKIVGAKSRQTLAPIFWDDNYVSLPPHTRKIFHAQFLNEEKPELKLQGWRVKFENTN